MVAHSILDTGRRDGCSDVAGGNRGGGFHLHIVLAKRGLTIRERDTGESFRPFAPSVLREEVANWFGLECRQPIYAHGCAGSVAARAAYDAEEQALFGIDKLNVVRSIIPAVTHVDYSARVQTVPRDHNPPF